MGKFIVRMTIIFTAVYMILAYIAAQFFFIDVLNDCYSLLFEVCVVVYAYSEGKYHCRHIKHLSAAILSSDVITRVDNAFDILTVTFHNMIPICLLAFAIIIIFINSLIHFYKTRKKYGKRQRNIAN